MADTVVPTFNITREQIAAFVKDPRTVRDIEAFLRMVREQLPLIVGTKVDDTRQIISGAGLTGGGDLTADRTLDIGAGTGITVGADSISLADTAVSPSTYGDATHVGQFTVDQQGRLTAAASIAITFPSSVANALTFATSGGVAPGGSFNGSAAVTIDYSSVGAQQLDATLTALAALTYTSGTLVPTLTAADTFTLKTVGSASGNILDKTAGDALYQPLDTTLTALAAYNTNGLIAQTAADTFAGRTLTGPAAGITVTNGNGVSGNPTLALANDLAALEALSGTNTIYYRSAADTWTAVTIGTGLTFSTGTLSASGGSGTVTTTGSPASGNLAKFSGATSVTNGDLSGDVTTSGALVATIANDAVTYAKMQNVSATSRILGRKTASSGDTEECTLSDILDFVGSAARGDILYRGASSWSRLAAGTAGQVLQTNGSGADPSWTTPTAGSGGAVQIWDAFTPTLQANTGNFGSRGGVLTPVNNCTIYALMFRFTPEVAATAGYDAQIVTLDGSNVVLTIVATVNLTPSGTASQQYTFTFSSPVALTAGTKYGILLTRRTVSGAVTFTMAGTGDNGVMMSTGASFIDTFLRATVNQCTVGTTYSSGTNSYWWAALVG